MTRWTDAELMNIRRSLQGYSHEAVARLIDAVAQDPERAQQLTDALDDLIESPPSRGFFPLACCVALSEAGVVTAMDVLFEAGTLDPTPPLELAAQAALQRLGEAALRFVMTRVEESSHPFHRSFGYGVLEAGVAANPTLRAEITDYCLTRATTEGRAPGKRQWGEWPAFTACATLAKLGDKSIRSTVEWWLSQEEGEVPHDLWQDLLAELHGAYAISAESHPKDKRELWQQPWPALCVRLLEETENHVAPIQRVSPKIGRNAPCPCGSGKKYKKCCLPLGNA